MGPACNMVKYFQFPRNPKFIGVQIIRGMVDMHRLGPLQVPKIPGTNHRWVPCLWTVQTVPTKQSYLYWNTKGCRHEGTERPHRCSKSIAVQRDKPSGKSHTSTSNIDKKINNTAETSPEETTTKSQTSTNPMQPSVLCDTPWIHQWLTRSNSPGIILAPLQNPITKTSEGEQLTYEGTRPNS